MFECVANSHKCPDTEPSLMLQCVLTGRAQEAYSALSTAESKIYTNVKSAVLKAYELVPKVYCQKFQGMHKCLDQMYTEFAQELSVQLTRWCSALQVETQGDLFTLVLVEQFKNGLPE